MDNKTFETICGSNPQSDNHLFSEKFTAWLKETPKISTFRVNLLKSNPEDLIKQIEQHLQEQTKLNKKKSLPSVRQIFPDTISISSWPEEEILENDADKKRYEVIVDAACGVAVLRGSNIYAPGVMSLSTDAAIDDEIDIYADISGKCKKGLKVEYPKEDKLFVGVGRLKMSRYKLFKSDEKLSGIAVETIMAASRVPVINDTLFPLGVCLLQNLPSIVCSKVLNPQSGDVILDMCASPGNKTSHIAEIMKDKGLVIALDKTESKINLIKKRCEEHAITCVHPFAFDSTKAVCENLKNDSYNLLNGPPFPSKSFDKILLDAPCSALGQRPMIKYNHSVKVLKSFVPLQRKLFYSAVQLLKVSGVLVYSTCTISLAECESMVAWALKTFPNLSLEPAKPLLGGPGWKTSGLTDSQRSMLQRFGPEINKTNEENNIYNNSIGFFIASFKKNQ